MSTNSNPTAAATTVDRPGRATYTAADMRRELRAYGARPARVPARGYWKRLEEDRLAELAMGAH